MELIEQVLLLLDQVLVLLKSNFVLPLDLLESTIIMENSLLAGSKVSHNNIMEFFLPLKEDYFIVSLVEWLNNLVIFIFLVRLLSSSVSVFLSVKGKCILKLVNNIKIRVGDFSIVSFNISILLSVFSSQFFDCKIFLFLNHFDLQLSLVVHFLSKKLHLVFILLMNFV